MGKKTPTNTTPCLSDLIEKASVDALRRFAQLPECQDFLSGFDWSLSQDQIKSAMLARIGKLKKDPREAADREALRVLRLASSRGAVILRTAADELRDEALIDFFLHQDGAELGRSLWMRCHDVQTARIFDIAESVFNTNEIHGNKRLYDAFDVPCDEAPSFVWTDSIRKELEQQFTASLKLSDPCDVTYLPLSETNAHGGQRITHFLVVRFAGDQIAAVKVVKGARERFCYYPARDATLVYAPHRKNVEVFAYSTASRAPLANVLSAHGFMHPLSHRPLNRTRYDLSRFAEPLRGLAPKLATLKVEKLVLTEARALIGHATDAITIHIDSGEELQDVAMQRWGNHPFCKAHALQGVTLVATFVFDGENTERTLTIKLSEPGRCSLQGEKDQRLRRAGEEILEYLGVLKRLNPGSGTDDPALLAQVCTLLECAQSPVDGVALHRLGLDMDRLVDEGVITEVSRIDSHKVEVAQGEFVTVTLQRSADHHQVFYTDPTTNHVVYMPVRHARRWKIDHKWLREEVVRALGTALKGFRPSVLEEDPVFLGEVTIDDSRVAVYFATQLSNARQFARVDSFLRLKPRPVPGIVLTTSSIPFPFAGTNVVIPIEDVLSDEHSVQPESQTNNSVDPERLAVAYRNCQLAARGGSAVSLKISSDSHSAVLSIPGKAPWQFTGKAKIMVIKRLFDAYSGSTPHVKTKVLMEGTSCNSLTNLFSKTDPWRTYIAKVEGSQSWQLHVGPTEVNEESSATELALHSSTQQE